MLIDWFTILAQIVNFLILVFLLRRFLYRPVLKAIDERERKIASSIQEAETKMQDAEKTRDLYQDKLEDFERQKAERFQELVEQLHSERQKTLAQIKLEADHESDRHRKTLQDEAIEFEQSFRRQLGAAVMNALERTFQDLSGESLEQRMIEKFITMMDLESSKSFQEQLASSDSIEGQKVSIISTWAISDPQRQLLENMIKNIWPESGPVRYETDPNQICGLSMHYGGYQLNWHVDDYLASLHECLETLVTLPESGQDPLEQEIHEG